MQNSYSKCQHKGQVLTRNEQGLIDKNKNKKQNKGDRPKQRQIKI